MDLFPDLPFPDLADIDAGEVKSAWPRSLAAMVDVVVAALARRGEPEERALELAVCALGAISRYHGGRMTYLPTGEALDRALRDNRMWLGYKGRREDIERMMREEKLTEQHVYRILAEQRALHLAKVQGALF